ncbi:MAG: bile acid:sodium symporter, partial [Psychrobacter alimentarius]
MESLEIVTLVNSVVIPICLFLIMMGMGLTLVTNDFKRVLKYPKAVGIGLANQLILLPVIGFSLANIMPLEPEYAVGVMLLVLCPGGTTSNLFTYLAKGDVALSVTMTAIASIITVFSIPVVLSFSLIHFMGAGSEFQ